MAFVIPFRSFGIFNTTIFIFLTSFYHLNKHSQPNIIRSNVSITASTATGRINPAITPRQNASAVSPAAFAQPFIHKLTTASHPQFFLYNIICLVGKCVIIILHFQNIYSIMKIRETVADVFLERRIPMDMSVIWIAAIIAFAVLELVTYQLVSVWFIIGSLGGLIMRLLGLDFAVQMIVFLVVSIASLCALRPMSMKLLKHDELKTNADSLIGREILITKAVDNINGSGEGIVNGMTWTVRGKDNAIIPDKSVAVIERIEGVKLIVSVKGEREGE